MHPLVCLMSARPDVLSIRSTCFVTVDKHDILAIRIQEVSNSAKRCVDNASRESDNRTSRKFSASVPFHILHRFMILLMDRRILLAGAFNDLLRS